MGTKLTELRSGCFYAAMDDEPMFVLLARDPRAPDHVEHWADDRERAIQSGNRPASDMDKVQEARETAQKMRDWRDANDGAWRAATLPFGDRMPPAPLVAPGIEHVHHRFEISGHIDQEMIRRAVQQAVKRRDDKL